MGTLFVSDERHHQLRRVRRRIWLLIAMCMFARGTDAAFGLGLIEPTHQLAAREVMSCSANSEHRT